MNAAGVPCRRWYAVHTQVRSEDKAAFHLRRQRYDVYLPQRLKYRRHARPPRRWALHIVLAGS